MLQKIKNILGIEGVKIGLTCPETLSKNETTIEGQVKLSSKSKNRISSIKIKLIEKYKRGRQEAILIDEYLLSEMELETDLLLQEGISETLNFSLPISLLLSDMDKLAQKNFITKGIVSMAKKAKNVKSYYRVEVEAFIEGVPVNAIAKQSIDFT